MTHPTPAPGPHRPQPSVRRYKGPDTWASIRARYLDGEPGPALAREYGVSLDTLRRRAGIEGWTRREQARFAAAPPEVRWSPRPGRPLSRREMTVAQFKATWPEVWGEMEDIAHECALLALTDHPEDAIPLDDWAYRFRAEHLGPECAAEDARLRAEREGTG